MKVLNSLTPSPAAIEAFLGSDFTGPVSMLNLLEFKQRAEYADGRASDLTGAEAYALYTSQMIPFVESKGGRMVFGGAVAAMILGEVEQPWDAVGIVEYPSKQAFVEIVSAPQVAEFSVHRTAGLEGQLLIATGEGMAR